MSYDLVFDCGPLDKKHDIGGGTYAFDGTSEPWMNITYNYSPHFRNFLGVEGLRSLYGLTADQVADRLERVIDEMGGEPSGDYWEPTEGNARKALQDLFQLARLCPGDSILNGD